MTEPNITDRDEVGLRGWKRVGLVATLVSVLAVPAYLARQALRPEAEGAATEAAAFVGARPQGSPSYEAPRQLYVRLRDVR